MTDELHNEAEKGATLARALVEHMECMGASNARFPIPGTDAMWVVRVERLGIDA